MVVLLAGYVPFESQSDAYDALVEYLNGHGDTLLTDTTGDGIPEIACLVRTADCTDEYPIEYATLTIRWQVRSGDWVGDDPATVPDLIQLQWLDRIDERFRQVGRYADVQASIPGPDGFTPTFGLHQDETHEELGPAHVQLEWAGDRDAERASVPYDLVGEPSVEVVSYFLDEASAQLSAVHEAGEY